MDKTTTLVMGIVNVTPDSFSDGGRFLEPSRALEHALGLVSEGADILDIGAESTRPGHTPVNSEDEWSRLQPLLSEIGAHTSVPISIDTYKASTARRAVEAGASIVNDVWGGLADPEILAVAAEANCTYIWMHNRPSPAAEDGFRVLLDETKAGIERCLQAGIAKEKLWIDPGIGFGKTHAQNLEVLRRLDEYVALGYPVLVGASRKRVVGMTVGGAPADRLEGSLAIAAFAAEHGARIVRVHDVAATVKTCRMIEAICHA